VNSENSEEIDYSWQCRRGMLELDLLLNNFITKAVDQLNALEKKSFEQLLSYPDQTLLDLLLGNTVSSDDKVSDIVQKIRSTRFD